MAIEGTKAIHAYTGAEAEVVKYEDKVFFLSAPGIPRAELPDDDGLYRWSAPEFFGYWHTEGSAEYGRVVRQRRQAAERALWRAGVRHVVVISAAGDNMIEVAGISLGDSEN